MMNSLTATLKSQFRSPRPVDYDRIEKKDEGMTMNNTSQSRISIPAELIQRSREGDHQAMEQIYERLKSPFFGLIFRYTRDKAAAEDVLQDVFIKIFTNLDKLDKDEAFLGWAYRIAVNTGLSHIRHNKMLLRKSIPLNGINHPLGDSEADGRENLLKRSLKKRWRT